MSEWISVNEVLPTDGDAGIIDVRIKLVNGDELHTWAQSDGDYWSELLHVFIPPEKVTHWKPEPEPKIVTP